MYLKIMASEIVVLRNCCAPMENNSQYPDRGELSEDDRLANELRNLKLMFPEKKFRIAEVGGIKKVEVVLDWW